MVSNCIKLFPFIIFILQKLEINLKFVNLIFFNLIHILLINCSYSSFNFTNFLKIKYFILSKDF